MKLPQIIKSLLETDLYKFSMGMTIYHQFPSYTTTWTFKCRNKDVHFTKEMVEEIREQIKAGKYIIMSSHQMEAVEEFCTNITILNRSKAVVQGNLNEIKKSYGRVNLLLKTEEDVSHILKQKNANVITEKEGEYHIKVSGDKEAQELLKAIIDAGITVIRFELSELTLHEIFVKEVGQE